ncbi:hypothetical protein F5877DRAFT_70148 [Lentinula edodes]|nr:hypothetical protein F5877DRAFT_70148 [Lentinula edodes]
MASREERNYRNTEAVLASLPNIETARLGLVYLELNKAKRIGTRHLDAKIESQAKELCNQLAQLFKVELKGWTSFWVASANALSILKTFWLPTSPAYFSLTASASTRTLSDHRFFYWDPQPLLFNGISCPSCSSLLHNEGRIKRGPLKIYDVERPFYIIGAEYVCKNEGKSFASTDPSILRALPAKLRDELPVRLVHVNDVGSDENIWCWKPAGVSKTSWNLVLGDTQKGIHQMVEPSKSSNSNEGFTDAYSDAWTANIATADEDNDSQRPDPPTESFSSYNQTSTVSYPSTSIRFKPYEYGPVGGTTQTLSSNGSESTPLHNTAPPVQSLSRSHSVSSSIVSSSAIAGPGHNEQLQTPALLSSSRPSPLSTTISPVPTHSTVDVPPASSSSSSSSPSTQQGQQQILHTQPQSHLHIHNPYQQTHTNLASAAHAPGPRNEPMTASLANTPHIHPRNGVCRPFSISLGPLLGRLSLSPQPPSQLQRRPQRMGPVNLANVIPDIVQNVARPPAKYVIYPSHNASSTGTLIKDMSNPLTHFIFSQIDELDSPNPTADFPQHRTKSPTIVCYTIIFPEACDSFTKYVDYIFMTVVGPSGYKEVVAGQDQQDSRKSPLCVLAHDCSLIIVPTTAQKQYGRDERYKFELQLLFALGVKQDSN